MKRVIVMLPMLALAASLFLVGCAAGGGSPQSLRATQQGKVVDVRKMAAIETVARQKGVEVVWIHPPETRSSD